MDDIDDIDDINTLKIPPYLTPEQADEFCIQKMIKDYFEYPHIMKSRFRQLIKTSPEEFDTLYTACGIRAMQYEMELLYIDGKLAIESPEKLAKLNFTPVTNLTESEKEKLRTDILIKQRVLREMKLYMTDIYDRNKTNIYTETKNTVLKQNEYTVLDWLKEFFIGLFYLALSIIGFVATLCLPLLIPLLILWISEH